MNEFLQSTLILDSDSPEIRTVAADIVADAQGDEEQARRLFHWVRDHIRHTIDHHDSVVTCQASHVLKHRTGFCYAKSHLLVAMLRSQGIPAALSYQRLAYDESGSEFYLHGLVSIYLKEHDWYRVDPRGDKPGVRSDFSPPVERLPFTPRVAGEENVDGLFAEPLACVVSTLGRDKTASEVRQNLPSHVPTAEKARSQQRLA